MRSNMSAQIKSIVPSEFNAGTTVKFNRSFNDYPASGNWTYKIYLAGAKTLNKAGTTAGDGFTVALSATDTATLTPGAYKYVERVTDGTDVFEVGSGVITVGMNIGTAADGAALTHEERTLMVLDAAIEGRLTDDIASYQVSGMAVQKIGMDELQKLRGIYAGKVWRQRNPCKVGPDVNVTFGQDTPYPPFLIER